MDRWMLATKPAARRENTRRGEGAKHGPPLLHTCRRGQATDVTSTHIEVGHNICNRRTKDVPTHQVTVLPTPVQST